MKRKIVALFLSIIMLGSFFNTVIAVTKNELNGQKSEIDSKKDDAQDELKDVQSQKSQTQKEIDILDKSIGEYETQIETLENEIKKLEKSIQEKAKEIEEKQEDFEKQEKLLRTRMVALYEMGETSYLDVILSSKSITEFISQYYMVTQIAELDTELMEKIEKERKEIEDAKTTLENQKNEIDENKKQKEQKNRELQNKKSERQSKVDKLSADEKSLQAQIDKYDTEMKNIDNQIRKLEEEARKKEEEEKKNQSSNNSSSSSNNSSSSSGKFVWPIPGYTSITSNYGMRLHPIYHVWRLHSGIDVGAPAGAKFVAADDGTVIVAKYGYNGGVGNYVVVSHGNGITTRYYHGTTILVSEGQTVKRGTPVLTVGSSGDSTGPHAHFEVRLNGSPVDPMPYLK